MRTKLSKLKTNISLLKEKLHECREIIHEKELKDADKILFASTPPPPEPVLSTLSEDSSALSTNL